MIGLPSLALGSNPSTGWVSLPCRWINVIFSLLLLHMWSLGQEERSGAVFGSSGALAKP